MHNPSSETYYLPRWLRSWEQFWFTPADPSLLALMRIACGLVVVYTLFAYSFNLQAQMGEYAWHDLALRMEIVRSRPVSVSPLTAVEAPAAPMPSDPFEQTYYKTYFEKWRSPPPGPYPISEEQAKELDEFRVKYGVDMRVLGLKPPRTPEEARFLSDYMELAPDPKMPPASYPANPKQAREILDYLDREGQDPRQLYAVGNSAFSLWFHVTDPRVMAILHGAFIVIAVFFTIGLFTRFAAALTWFASICYIHRNPTMLFGADTMMLILLFYLMVAPSGAVLSVDRLLRGWWAKAKPRWVRWWYALRKQPLPADQPIASFDPALAEAPSVSANLVIRLLQVHLCIIYLIAGLSKLQGATWWNGMALWGVLANFEFAPMASEWYLSLLRFMGTSPLYLDGFLAFGGLFTLAFEISYIFLIWRPNTRWLFLGAAILLHGGIGLFMGLRTFAMLMLVMNMAFLRSDEVAWLLNFLTLRNVPAEKPRPAEPATAKVGG